MTKYIKAKRCYICGRLFDVSDGGWLIAKRYALYGSSNKDVFICHECGLHMMQYIKSQKESEKGGEE